MTSWERKILSALESHYFSSAPETGEDRNVLRLRASVFFPNFDTASSDEKESYLEAAESLERKGIIKLSWEKRGKGERLKVLSCDNFEKLFEAAGKPYPKTEAEKIRAMLREKTFVLKESMSHGKTALAEKAIAFLEHLSLSFSPREIGQDINRNAMEDLVKLLEFYSSTAQKVGELNPSARITTRALSILLYRDSKHLEDLLALCKPLFSRAEKTVPVPDFSFLERSFPETMISGKIVLEYKSQKTPLINADGHILGIPLENSEEIESIKLLSGKKEKLVLTIENKETFYALASPQGQSAGEGLLRYDCFLYIGGYFNRAATAIVKVLAASGFAFSHAGDLDPDGILILQQIRETAGRPVAPLRMDAASFDKYQPWARTLTKPALHQIVKIKDETRAIPELAGLIKRIEETGLGVEQEIIDYR